MSDDRRVHARLINGTEIVRYSRAGKWYSEPKKSWGATPRYLLTIAEAVRLARQKGTMVYLEVPGGSTFDRLIQKETR